jgi:hypothetical protein
MGCRVEQAVNTSLGRELLRLVLPALLMQVVQTVGWLGEAVFVSRLGKVELAAIGLVGKILEIVTDKKLTGTTDRRITHGYLEETRHFISCILNDETPLTNLTDAAKMMDLVERIERFAVT